MADVRELEIQAMKEMVDMAVGIPLFTYEMLQNAPRPVGEYAAVKCTESLNPCGADETRYITKNGVDLFTSRGIRVLTFYVLFSREGEEYINFDNAFVRPDVIAFMKAKKFAVMGKQPLSLATIQMETNWESRAGVKIQFNVLRTTESPIGTMDNAIVGGKFYDGNTVVTIKGT